jgi:hypothetical protein
MGQGRMPVRLQLSRRKGFDLQAVSLATNGLPAVNVARPSRWGNSFKVGEDHSYYGGPGFEQATAEQCVELFRQVLDAQPIAPLRMLRGKNLACWCKAGEPCHADVLLELANRPVCDTPTPAEGGA